MVANQNDLANDHVLFYLIPERDALSKISWCSEVTWSRVQVQAISFEEIGVSSPWLFSSFPKRKIPALIV